MRGRGVVFVARGRLGQLDQAFAGFPKAKVQGLGVHKGVAKIVDLVEVPHEHLRKGGVLRVFAGGPQQLGAQQIPQVGVVLDAQVAVEGILYVSEVLGLGAHQTQRGINHAFVVSASALEVGQLVIEIVHAQLHAFGVYLERPVELIQLDESVRECDDAAAFGFQPAQRLIKCLPRFRLLLKMHVQLPQFDVRRGARVLVAHAAFDQLLGRVKVVHSEQHVVVHVEHLLGLRSLPDLVEVEFGLSV